MCPLRSLMPLPSLDPPESERSPQTLWSRGCSADRNVNSRPGGVGIGFCRAQLRRPAPWEHGYLSQQPPPDWETLALSSRPFVCPLLPLVTSCICVTLCLLHGSPTHPEHPGDKFHRQPYPPVQALGHVQPLLSGPVSWPSNSWVSRPSFQSPAPPLGAPLGFCVQVRLTLGQRAICEEFSLGSQWPSPSPKLLALPVPSLWDLCTHCLTFIVLFLHNYSSLLLWVSFCLPQTPVSLFPLQLLFPTINYMCINENLSSMRAGSFLFCSLLSPQNLGHVPAHPSTQFISAEWMCNRQHVLENIQIMYFSPLYIVMSRVP